MLKHVPPALPPEFLKVLCETGHGSEIVLADANFPASDYIDADRIIRSDAAKLPATLEDVLYLFPLDRTADNVILMRADAPDPEPVIWQSYRDILAREPDAAVGEIDRFAFYERVRKARCVFVTGERSPYANVILKKGTIHDWEEETCAE